VNPIRRLLSRIAYNPVAALGKVEEQCPECAIPRRRILQLGIGAYFATLFSPRMQYLFAEETAAIGKAKNVILLWLDGGPSHLDLWDPKEGGDTAGEFKPIRTNVEGIRLSENLKRTAKVCDKLAIVRSMTSREGNHQRARYLLHTGYAPNPTIQHPSWGSLVSSEMGPEGFDLPHFISVNNPSFGPGFLGVAHSPFVVADPTRPIENLAYAGGVDRDRFMRRMELLETLETGFEKKHATGEVAAQRSIYGRTEDLMHSARLKAFQLEEEPQALREKYGMSRFGQGALLARRLVQVGVRFVEVTLGGWDTHRDNFTTVREKTANDLDPALATLIEDLSSRGMLETTLVMCMGEFGRTPRINANGGRDHYAKTWSAVLAGGGIKGGQVIGATTADGTEIQDRPVQVPDLFATIAKCLGLDGGKRFDTPIGRPIKMVDGGKAVPELLA